MVDETRNSEQPESHSADERKDQQKTLSSGTPANPGEETRNEDANPSAGGR